MCNESSVAALVCKLLPRLISDLIIRLNQVDFFTFFYERLLCLLFFRRSAVNLRESRKDHIPVRLQQSDHVIFVVCINARCRNNLNLPQSNLSLANVYQQEQPLL